MPAKGMPGHRGPDRGKAITKSRRQLRERQVEDSAAPKKWSGQGHRRSSRAPAPTGQRGPHQSDPGGDADTTSDYDRENLQERWQSPAAWPSSRWARPRDGDEEKKAARGRAQRTRAAVTKVSSRCGWRCCVGGRGARPLKLSGDEGPRRRIGGAAEETIRTLENAGSRARSSSQSKPRRRDARLNADERVRRLLKAGNRSHEGRAGRRRSERLRLYSRRKRHPDPQRRPGQSVDGDRRDSALTTSRGGKNTAASRGTAAELWGREFAWTKVNGPRLSSVRDDVEGLRYGSVQEPGNLDFSSLNNDLREARTAR